MRRYMWSLLAAFGVLVSALVAEANQGGGSALQGRVVDAQQAVLPGVAIVVTNQDNGTFRETVSGPDGAYFVPGLQPGRYRITADLPGLQEARSGGCGSASGHHPDGRAPARRRGRRGDGHGHRGGATCGPDVGPRRRQRRIARTARPSVTHAQLHLVRRDGTRRPAESERGRDPIRSASTVRAAIR